MEITETRVPRNPVRAKLGVFRCLLLIKNEQVKQQNIAQDAELNVSGPEQSLGMCDWPQALTVAVSYLLFFCSAMQSVKSRVIIPI